MKKIKISFALLFLSTVLFAQSNKPEANSFGLGYTINFSNSGANQAINLNYWMKNNLELTTSLTVGLYNNISAYYDSTNVYTLSGNRRLVRKNNTNTGNYNVGVYVGLLKHFKTNNNLDLFIGGGIPIAFGNTFTDKNVVEVTGLDYVSTNKGERKYPISFNTGLSLVIGCNYFFYKNLALGVRGSFGFGTSFSKGDRKQIVTNTDSGSQNPSLGTNTTTTINSSGYSNFSLNGLYSGGLTLSYYFKMKDKKKTP